MTRRLPARTAYSFALAAALAFLPRIGAQDPEPTEPKGTKVLTRGPLHEAFAQPGQAEAGPAPVVAKRPPEPINEQVPDTKPDDDGVVWIPGYWAYDDTAKDFLWVSGVWRVPPPGRKWMAGAWSPVTGGYQWSSGFWADESQQEAALLPEPPAAEEEEPPPAPDGNSFFAPGHWVMGQKEYEWVPGAWTAFKPGWVWTPPRYYPTPAGWVFADGFWDVPLENRGTLYAPVAFTSPVWQNPGWTYTPSYSVSQTAITDSLFVGPGGRRYVFGDYYGKTWERLGYRPWFRSAAAAALFHYYRWHHRGEPGWERGLEHRWRERHEGRLARPAATLAAQHRLLADRRHDAAARAALHVAHKADRLAHHVRVGAEHRRAAEQHRRHLHEAARARAAAHHPAARAGARAALKLAHHPAARHAAGHVAKKAAAHKPPPRPNHPKPHPKPPAKKGGGGGKKKR
jgi:hypothetical protein